MSGEVMRTHGPSPVARGRTYLPGRMRAAAALGCCGLVFGGLVWMMWPRPAREPDPSAAPGTTWGMGRVLPEHLPRTIPQATTVAAVPTPPPPAAPAVTPVVVPVVPPGEFHTMGFWEDANAAREPGRQAASRASVGSSP